MTEIEEPTLLRINDVIRLSNLGRNTIYNEINAGRLKVRRFGRAVRVHRDDFNAWAAGKRSASRH